MIKDRFNIAKPLRLEVLLDLPSPPHEVQVDHAWNPMDSSDNIDVDLGNDINKYHPLGGELINSAHTLSSLVPFGPILESTLESTLQFAMSQLTTALKIKTYKKVASHLAAEK